MNTQRSNTWLHSRRMLLLLVAFVFALYPDAVLGLRTFVFRDFGIFTYPVAFYQRERFWQGELPHWNPFNNCGIPFLAQWNTATLYPPTLIYLLLPLSWGLPLFLLLHVIWAGLGMYRLARQWTGSHFGAAVAGLAFAGNGLTQNCLVWTSVLAALAWMPWVVWCVERAWQKGGRTVAWAALAGALQMLTGTPEVIVLTWLLLAALWLGHILRKTATPRCWWWTFPVLVLLVTLLTAVQLLPFLELLRHSDRVGVVGARVWSIPTWGWVNLILPLFHCYRSPGGVFFQPWQDWTSSYYPGLGVLALALLALPLVRGGRVWLLAGAAVFGFVAALGDEGGLYPLLGKVFPPLSLMRYPIKFLFLTLFAMPLLAAWTIAVATDLTEQAAARWRRWVLGMAMTLVLVLLGALVWSKVRPFPNESWSALAAGGGLRVLLLAAFLGVLWFAVRPSANRSTARLALAALVLLGLDLATHAPRQNPTVTASAFAPGLLNEKLPTLQTPGAGRAFMDKKTHDAFYGSMLRDLEKDYLGRRMVLFGDCNLLDALPVPDGFFSLYVREQRALFVDLFNASAETFPQGLADFLGLAYRPRPGAMFEWQERSSALPLATLGMQPRFLKESDTPAALLDRAFDPRTTLILPEEAAAKVQAKNAAKASVLERRIHPERLELEVQSDGPAWLAVAQTYYPGWQATVEGKPTPIWRANYAYQAVEVPAGRSRVSFVYRDDSFRRGAWISGWAWTALAIWLGRGALAPAKR